MLKRMILAGTILSLFCGQTVFAKTTSLPPSGNHFKISSVPASTSISVTTTTPNKTYPTAGIKILTSGYSLPGTPSSNGYYLFSVSDTSPATLTFSGKVGNVSVQLCLNGVGDTYTCEKYSVAVSTSHFIFITSTLTNGALGGLSGADDFCKSIAHQAGSIIPTGLTFKALLVTSTRYPCDGTGLCGNSHAMNWPLIAGKEYVYPDGVTVFNTVNGNGVFDGSNQFLEDESGNTNNGQFFSGIQSILTNSTGTDIVGWAYADANVPGDGLVYAAHSPSTCVDYTSASGLDLTSVGNSSQSIRVMGAIPNNTWGNYFYFGNNNTDNTIENLFSTFQFSPPCSEQQSVVCVS